MTLLHILIPHLINPGTISDLCSTYLETGRRMSSPHHLISTIPSTSASPSIQVQYVCEQGGTHAPRCSTRPDPTPLAEFHSSFELTLKFILMHDVVMGGRHVYHCWFSGVDANLFGIFGYWRKRGKFFNNIALAYTGCDGHDEPWAS